MYRGRIKAPAWKIPGGRIGENALSPEEKWDELGNVLRQVFQGVPESGFGLSKLKERVELASGKALDQSIGTPLSGSAGGER